MSKFVKKTPSKTKVSGKDPVEVYCRLKPVQDGISCVKLIDTKTILLSQPDFVNNNRGVNQKAVQYMFQEVFDEKCSQKEVFDRIAYPLVKGLILGQNGLLFTYGVTGSGKTFTMNGTPENGGILPRTLDVLFNSISTVQARKFIFKPDKMNGFEIQSEVDAKADMHKELIQAQKAPKTPRRMPSDNNLADRVPDLDKFQDIDDDCLYSVFVSHIEIYNNHIYDLLEENSGDGMRARVPQSKILREDANHIMFVHGVNEVEVTSTEEAFEIFYRGQKRKRMAQTSLNVESSRSHSVFTLRLVQAPLNSAGDEIMLEKNIMCVSQLSLVDLAGSERTNRTNNRGQRLREAGNINNSLLTLRTCFEVLRENQMNGTSKVVPYRQSRLTHLFKNYFDGEGQVKMIVCINPNAEDYDETVHVLKFADMSQEVQVARPTPMKFDLGLTPRRRRNHINGNEATDSSPELTIVHSLGPVFPTLELTNPNDADLIKNLMNFLEMRIERRSLLQKELSIKHQNLRSRLVEVENEHTLAKQEVASAKAMLELERRKIAALEDKVVNLDSFSTDLKKKIHEKDNEIESLRSELDSVTAGLSQKVIEKEREAHKLKQKIQTEKQRANKELHHKQKQLAAEYKTQMWMKDEKLRRVKEIISKECPLQVGSPCVTPSSSEQDICSSDSAVPSVPPVSWALPADTPKEAKERRRDAHPSSHRRSQSASNAESVWLDHRPITSPVPLSTVLQPKMRRRKSVSQLTDAKDLSNSKTTKYCLTTQAADSSGEVETRLYKGDVIHTTGGGAQVVFNDLETLRQSSPTKSKGKRKSDEDLSNINGNNADADGKCHISFEGHGKRSRR
ncbi:hypothetical protein J437_LFUL004639 [Ladona fulva]|uniref:Kinesin-like protein n=1 Tax=Ladona fulva TaxID=123851 RepID=A0A8K0NX65_LADFU|nr:hypothetical protein J437_LFUL004639 [Ladona fulva]